MTVLQEQQTVMHLRVATIGDASLDVDTECSFLDRTVASSARGKKLLKLGSHRT